MSRALLAIFGLGIAAVVIYSIWKYYKEDEEEILAVPSIEEEEEKSEIPPVPLPRPPEEVEEELPYSPPTPTLDDWETLANLEYSDLHVCPIDAVSFPSMSAMLWHVKLGHHSYPIQNTYPRYNKVCVLLRILTPSGDPAVGIRVQLYQDQALKGQFITDVYGCGDFIRLDAGTFRLSIDQTEDYRGKELLLTARLETMEVKTVDVAGNESAITIVVASLNEVRLEKHGWELIEERKRVVIAPAPAPTPTPAPPSPPEIIQPEPAPDPAIAREIALLEKSLAYIRDPEEVYKRQAKIAELRAML